MFFRGSTEETIKNKMRQFSNTRKKLQTEIKIPEGIVSQINGMVKRPLSNITLLGFGTSYITMEGQKSGDVTIINLNLSTEFFPGKEIDGKYYEGENQFAVDRIHKNYRDQYKTKKVKVWYLIVIKYYKEEGQAIFNPADISTTMQFEGEDNISTNSVALKERVGRINQKVVARLLSLVAIKY
ncbi:hypothetical protein HN840_04155 [archaeon]|jgi:hypothetical protein|nr:hypothetical protein [archaeon]MBT5029836.1 hypothetical protein [archaeon]MBT5288049.1 hypothetical protein [archaeon]MBT7281494.1 hypothetical protein [archaeon]